MALPVLMALSYVNGIGKTNLMKPPLLPPDVSDGSVWGRMLRLVLLFRMAMLRGASYWWRKLVSSDTLFARLPICTCSGPVKSCTVLGYDVQGGDLLDIHLYRRLASAGLTAGEHG